jgi:predicted nucleic acid-binding Zn ribbon protein
LEKRVIRERERERERKFKSMVIEYLVVVLLFLHVYDFTLLVCNGGPKRMI